MKNYIKLNKDFKAFLLLSPIKKQVFYNIVYHFYMYLELN
jgi:hypothetical protein